MRVATGAAPTSAHNMRDKGPLDRTFLNFESCVIEIIVIGIGMLSTNVIRRMAPLNKWAMDISTAQYGNSTVGSLTRAHSGQWLH